MVGVRLPDGHGGSVLRTRRRGANPAGRTSLRARGTRERFGWQATCSGNQRSATAGKPRAGRTRERYGWQASCSANQGAPWLASSFVLHDSCVMCCSDECTRASARLASFMSHASCFDLSAVPADAPTGAAVPHIALVARPASSRHGLPIAGPHEFPFTSRNRSFSHRGRARGTWSHRF